MNKIPCEVVRDLFPSYIDQLTSETTNRCIEEHVETCEPCREILKTMQAPDAQEETPSGSDAKEIDFLKKNRRRNKWIIWGAAAAIVIILAVVFITRYMIGTYHSDMTGDYYMWDLQIDGNQLSLDGRVVDNIFKIVSLDFTEEDGVITGKAKVVPSGTVARIIYPDSYHREYTASEPIRQLIINDRILWSDGSPVSTLASSIYLNRHDYLGDMPANTRTGNLLGLGIYLGPYLNELQTAEPPYSWTIQLQEDIPERVRAIREADMESFGYVLLASIGNMDSVIFEYTVDGKAASKTITSQEATSFLGQDIKDCMSDVTLLDQLIQKCGLDHYVFGTSLYPSYDSTAADIINDVALPIFIHVVNNADEDLKGFMADIYIDGQLIESQGAENADGSSLEKGQLMGLTIDSHSMPKDLNSNSMLELAFTVYTQDETAYEIPGMLRVPLTTQLPYDIHITGNADAGFEVKQ